MQCGNACFLPAWRYDVRGKLYSLCGKCYLLRSGKKSPPDGGCRREATRAVEYIGVAVIPVLPDIVILNFGFAFCGFAFGLVGLQAA